MAMRVRWTDDMVASQLREVASKLGGRMPSANDLRAMGLESLASRASRVGGLLGWAERLGLPTGKDAHSPAFGESWETYAAVVLKANGYVAESQKRHAPFDVLVNGQIRVNVKASRRHDYEDVGVRGFTFWIGDTWKRCDVFALVKVDGPTPPILWVPSSEAQQQTITLTGKHRLNAFTSMGVLGPRP